jgi:O-antigen ligase
MATATLLTGLGSTLAFSRGAFVGFALLIVLMTAMRYLRAKQLAGLAMGFVLVLLLIPQMATRLESLNPIVGLLSEDVVDSPDNSVLSRVTENLAALLVFADHPLVGVGPGLFPVYYGEYAQQVGILTKAGNREAHNLFLGVAAEGGIFGFLAFMGAVLVTLVGLARARRRWLRERPELALMATGFLLALVAYLTTGLFLHLSYARYFWVMLALGGAAAFVAEREARAVDATGPARGRPVAAPSAEPPPRTPPSRPAPALLPAGRPTLRP